MADYTAQVFIGSDSGDGDQRGQTNRLDRNLSLDDVVAIGQLDQRRVRSGNRTFTVSLTPPRGGRPGGWYIKGLTETRYTREEIEQRIQANRQNPKYRNRKCYIITI